MMKRLIAVLMVFAYTARAEPAEGYGNRVRYWYSQNIDTNVPDIETIVRLRVEQSGTTSFRWLIPTFPSVSTLEAYDKATVDDWVAMTTSNNVVQMPNVAVSKYVTVGGVPIRNKGSRLHVERLTIDSEDDSGGIWSDGDVEITGDTRGLLLKSTSTNNLTTNTWLYVPDEDGRIIQVLVAESPMIPHTQRVARVKARLAKRRKTRKNWNGNGQLRARLEQIEKLLGLRPLDE